MHKLLSCFRFFKYNFLSSCHYERLIIRRDELTTSGVAPEGRRSHSAIKYRNGIIIFGGGSKNSFKHFNDLFLFNSDTYLWTRLNPWGKRPHARRRAGTCLIGSKVSFLKVFANYTYFPV